jgi:hypothetical protein
MIGRSTCAPPTFSKTKKSRRMDRCACAGAGASGKRQRSACAAAAGCGQTGRACGDRHPLANAHAHTFGSSYTHQCGAAGFANSQGSTVSHAHATSTHDDCRARAFTNARTSDNGCYAGGANRGTAHIHACAGGADGGATAAHICACSTHGSTAYPRTAHADTVASTDYHAHLSATSATAAALIQCLYG